MEGTPASSWEVLLEVSADCSQEGTPRFAISFKVSESGCF